MRHNPNIENTSGLHSRFKVVERVFLRAEPEIAVLVEPDGQRVPVGDEEPLPYVKLGVVDTQRPFDVLLHDHGATVALRLLQARAQLVGHLDAATT